MPRTGISWTVSPTQAFVPGMAAYVAAIRRGVRALADRFAPEIESWMKTNKLWVDRTGNATQSLHTEVEQVSLYMVEIILAHGVSYGIYLEAKPAYGILAPAIDVFGPRIWSAVQAMLR